jgi:two-component system, OmpR family, sensor histidine kinase BaeS
VKVRRSGLGWQLGLAFALVAVATALISGAVLSGIWQRLFVDYVKQRVQTTTEDLAVQVGERYVSRGGWVGADLDTLAHFALMNGYRVQIYNDKTQLMADSGVNGSPMGGTQETLLAIPAQNLAGSAPIVAYGRTVGTLKLWSLSPTGMLERDLQLQEASVRGLAIAAVIAVLLASAAGWLYARRIVRPINQVTATAAALRAGDQDARTGMEGDDPVGNLGRTLDQMADSIEADRLAERRLTADVAHELRTPLQAIQATVEAMQDGVLPADEKHLETVRNETVRLARLADSILELARLERGAVPLRREPLDPAVPLLAALDIHRALIESAGLTLVEDVQRGLTVSGDTDRLTQAFGNLLSNAARYTPHGGTVTARLSAEDGEAVVSVTDTGIGISEDDLAQVFVRFWRADAARSRATGGLGVGLAVVKEIVDRHEGRLIVASKPDEGATFTIRLPLQREEVAPQQPRVRVPGFRRAG